MTDVKAALRALRPVTTFLDTRIEHRGDKAFDRQAYRRVIPRESSERTAKASHGVVVVRLFDPHRRAKLLVEQHANIVDSHGKRRIRNRSWERGRQPSPGLSHQLSEFFRFESRWR